MVRLDPYNELWKPVKGYEGLYEVSSLGRVKSCSRCLIRSNGRPFHFGNRLLRPQLNKDGYLVANLTKSGKEKGVYIHRLVAETFLNNPNHYAEINHKDENKKNNSVENLEWCNRRYNCNYGTRNRRIALSNSKSKLMKEHLKRLSQAMSKPVLKLDSENEQVLQLFPSTKATEAYGFDPSHVAACCRGTRLTHKGFRWAYQGGIN